MGGGACFDEHPASRRIGKTKKCDLRMWFSVSIADLYQSAAFSFFFRDLL
jgi:hypothetical protein